MDENKNAYLALAHRAILTTRRPMTPIEMLEVARNAGFLPSHLHGDTMHKTLQARLSEVIQKQGSKSAFYRTRPATFFLQSLAESPETPSEYKKVYKGNPRSKQIRKEDVLVMDRTRLKGMIYGEFVHFDHDAFSGIYQSECFYMDRKTAELDSTVKQFVTFTLVHHGTKLLVYRRGKFTTTSDRLKGQMTVGFGGHVNNKDFDLFHRAGDGFRNNAARELREELYLGDMYDDIEETIERTNVVGFINVDTSEDAEHHIAVLTTFQHKNEKLPQKGELSINQIAWHDLRNKYNDLSDFDHWSQLILKGLYAGTIQLNSGA